MRARFGEFIVDFETRQLLRDAHPVHLTPKAYQLLVLLVEAQPRALSKDELQQGLWPSTFVDEANLSVVVAELRSALGDDARQPRYVRTVHGFGYAFAATVARDQPTPAPGSLRGGAWWLIPRARTRSCRRARTRLDANCRRTYGSTREVSRGVTRRSSWRA